MNDYRLPCLPQMIAKVRVLALMGVFFGASCTTLAASVGDWCAQQISPDPDCCDHLIENVPCIEGCGEEPCCGSVDSNGTTTQIAVGELTSGFMYTDFDWNGYLQGCAYHPAFCDAAGKCRNRSWTVTLRCRRQPMIDVNPCPG